MSVENQKDRHEEEPEVGQQAEAFQQYVVPPPPYYTFWMVGCLVVVFIAQFNFGILESAQDMAFDKQSFLRGERYWTFLTSMVTHGSIPHIFFNAFALYNFGRLFEVLSNRGHMPTIFFLSAICGSLLSLFVNPMIASIGASGGIIGLLGYVAVYSVKRKQFLDPRFRRDIFVNIGFIALMGFVLYGVVDNYAHLGGLLAGAVYGLIQIPSDPEVDPRTINPVTDGVGFVCIGLFTALCGFTALRLLDVI